MWFRKYVKKDNTVPPKSKYLKAVAQREFADREEPLKSFCEVFAKKDKNNE